MNGSAADAAQVALPDRSPPGDSLQVLGARLDVVTATEALTTITSWLPLGHGPPSETPARTRQVVTLNVEMVMAAREQARFREVINTADLVVPDSVGVVWAARLHGRRIPTRVTGVDSMVALAERAAERGWKLFLLGAGPGIAERAAQQLCARFPRLDVVGVHAGSPDSGADVASTRLVRASGADIVFVAFGPPAQELWIARNRDRLGARVAMGVGGAFDMLAGEVPRAPVWMQRGGLEWVYRLARQPWRWRRMLALPRFVAAVLREQWL